MPGRDNTQDIPDILDALRGLRWPARNAVRSGIPGGHPSRLRGASAEFMEYRPYRQGDDTARIDWKLLGRTDRAFVRLSNDRAILSTTIVIDASASMDFPEGHLSKWNIARELAIGLASVARNGGDPVGLLVPHASRPIRVSPGARSSVLHEIMRELRGVSPGGSEPMADFISYAGKSAGRVVVISDFLGDSAEMLESVSRWVVAGREIHAVHVVADDELDPADTRALVGDPENDQHRRSLGPDTRPEYLRAFAKWRADIAHDWSDAGVAWNVVVTGSETTAHAVRRITDARVDGGQA